MLVALGPCFYHVVKENTDKQGLKKCFYVVVVLFVYGVSVAKARGGISACFRDQRDPFGWTPMEFNSLLILVYDLVWLHLH